jgi:hypothetical protein
MRDFLFYPLAATLAGAFIFVALDPYAARLPSGPVSAGGRNVEDVTVAGPELNRFITGEELSVSIDIRPAADGETVLWISRDAGVSYDDPRRGPHLVIAEDIEYAMESRPIEVIVEARQGTNFPASQFEVNYFSKVEGESGWVAFNLTPDFQAHTLSYHTPQRGGDMGYDYIGIRPVAPDKHREMEVRSVRVRAAGAKGDAPAQAGRELLR